MCQSWAYQPLSQSWAKSLTLPEFTSNSWRQVLQNDGRDQDDQGDRRRKREKLHPSRRTQRVPHPAPEPYSPRENEQPGAIHEAQDCQRLLPGRRCRWICRQQGEKQKKCNIMSTSRSLLAVLLLFLWLILVAAKTSRNFPGG